MSYEKLLSARVFGFEVRFFTLSKFMLKFPKKGSNCVCNYIYIYMYHKHHLTIR